MASALLWRLMTRGDPIPVRSAVAERRERRTGRRRVRRLAALLAVLGLGSAHADDDWVGGDKRAHFLGGLIVGGITSEHTGSRGPGVLMGCGVGVFGELIEAARYGWFSPRVSAKDFGAECLGGVMGAYIGTQMAPSERVASSQAKTAGHNDSWTGIDKVSHFVGGIAVSGLVSHLSDSATAGLLTGCGISAAGELVDAARYGWHSKHASARDFAVGCLGAVTGAFVAVQIAPGRIVWNKQF
jgi:uncharacterized protein YfiM (DUF2279 family)